MFHSETNKIFKLYSELQFRGNGIHRKAWKRRLVMNLTWSEFNAKHWKTGKIPFSIPTNQEKHFKVQKVESVINFKVNCYVMWVCVVMVLMSLA
jgi:hypothetical protein